MQFASELLSSNLEQVEALGRFRLPDLSRLLRLGRRGLVSKLSALERESGLFEFQLRLKLQAIIFGYVG